MSCATSHSKLCTQAVLAPVVEWYLAKDVVAYDAREPMCVFIEDHGKHIRITKKLGLRTWNERPLGWVQVTIVADSVHDSLIVSITTLDGRSPQECPHTR